MKYIKDNQYYIALQYSSLIISVLLVAILMFQPNVAKAAIYSYVDSRGVAHFTDVPNDKRYTVFFKGSASALPNGRKLVKTRRFNSTNIARKPQFDAIIAEASYRHNIDSALLHAVITVESGYNPNAVSPKGATGLMQLMPQTARRYGIANARDPKQNIHAGASYIKDLMRLYGNDMRLVLAAYNAGENAVLKYGNKIPPYRETQDYVPKVLSYYHRYRTNDTKATVVKVGINNGKTFAQPTPPIKSPSKLSSSPYSVRF